MTLWRRDGGLRGNPLHGVKAKTDGQSETDYSEGENEIPSSQSKKLLQRKTESWAITFKGPLTAPAEPEWFAALVICAVGHNPLAAPVTCIWTKASRRFHHFYLILSGLSLSMLIDVLIHIISYFCHVYFMTILNTCLKEIKEQWEYQIKRFYFFYLYQPSSK